MSTEYFDENDSDLTFFQRHPTFTIAAITVLSVISLALAITSGYLFAKNEKTIQQLNTVNSKIDNLQYEISLIRNKPDKANFTQNNLSEKLNQIESRLAEIDSNVSDIKENITNSENGFSTVKNDVNDNQLKNDY